jgi:hypothetical protein
VITEEGAKMRMSEILLALTVSSYVLGADEAIGQWVAAVGVETQAITAFAAKDSILIAGAMGGSYSPGDTMYYGGIFISTDKGSSWRASNDGLFSGSYYTVDIRKFLVTGNRILAATQNGVFVSDSRGQTWSQSISGITDLQIRCFTSVGSFVFAGTGGESQYPPYAWGHVYRSSDLGSSWAPADSGLPRGEITSLFSLDTLLFAGSITSGIYRSTDYGSIWTLCPGSPAYSSRMTSVGSEIIAGSLYRSVDKSTDWGDSWIRCDSGIANMFVGPIVSHEGFLFAGTFFNGIFRSSDSARHWISINTSTTENLQVSDIIVTNSRMFIGTTTGIYSRPLEQIVTSVSNRARGQSFGCVLYNGYPNPFNPTTTIPFVISTRSSVDIRVYTVLGKEVATLMHETMNPGEYSVTFSGEHLPSGVYCCRLRAGGYEMVQKLILLR